MERFSKASRPPVPVPRPRKLPLALDEAVAEAQDIFPDGRPYFITLSDDRGQQSIVLEQMVNYAEGIASRRLVAVNLSTGEITHVAEPIHATFTTAFIQWQWRCIPAASQDGPATSPFALPPWSVRCFW